MFFWSSDIWPFFTYTSTTCIFVYENTGFLTSLRPNLSTLLLLLHTTCTYMCALLAYLRSRECSSLITFLSFFTSLLTFPSSAFSRTQSFLSLILNTPARSSVMCEFNFDKGVICRLFHTNMYSFWNMLSLTSANLEKNWNTFLQCLFPPVSSSLAGVRQVFWV